MSWSWKTKPRSIIKTIQWFPYFALLKGENWNGKSTAVSRKDGKAVHPIYIQPIEMRIHGYHLYLGVIICQAEKIKKKLKPMEGWIKEHMNFLDLGM